MIERAFSIATSNGLSTKTPFQKCIPFLVTCMLGAELVIMVSLVVFYAKSGKSDNLLYIATVFYINTATIYLAWHSIVKENSFELLAFCLMSTILNIVSIAFIIKHSVADTIKWSCIGFFIAVQIAYYLLSLYLYKHFHHFVINDASQSYIERNLNVVKAFEMFLSMIKLDFLLYSIIMATYFYYTVFKWDGFETWAILIGAILGVLLVIHNIIGWYALIKEKKKILVYYFIGMAISLLIKVYFLVIVTMQPGKSIMKLLIEQDYVVFVGDVIVNGGIIYLGYHTHKSFGIGVMKMIRTESEDASKMPFL